jgi:hypothetical protein
MEAAEQEIGCAGRGGGEFGSDGLGHGELPFLSMGFDYMGGLGRDAKVWGIGAARDPRDC